MIAKRCSLVGYFSAPVILIILFVTIVHDQTMDAQATDGCGTSLSQPCKGAIIETPGGQMDGANALFTLSSTPISPFDVRVVESGIVLRWGRDYSVEGRTLKFTEHAVPSGRDVLRVSYQSQFTLPEIDVPSRGGKQPSATNIDSVVDAALLRAILRQRDNRSQNRIPVGDASQASATDAREIRSLSMLATRVSSADHSTATHPKRSGQDQTLTGADGLGDNNPPLIYSVLGTASPLGLINEAHIRTESRAPVQPPAKALGMLEQRLSDTVSAPRRRTE